MTTVCLGLASSHALAQNPGGNEPAAAPSTTASAPGVTGGPAEAAPETETVESLARQARARYGEGRFGEAVGLYLQAYKLAPASALLYNVALIYDKKLNEPELAIQFYRRYIAAPDADPKVAQRATIRVQTLKAQKAAQSPIVTDPNVGLISDPGPVVGGEVPRAQENNQALAGWVTAGAGAVLVVGGVFFGLSASASESDFDAATSLSQKQSLRDDGERQALVSDVLTITGLAAIGVGLWLALTAEEPSQRKGVSVGVAPTAEGGFGFWLGGDL
ncbi:MAG: tetratricopeptide repeat protein [Bradymonadia bacterium]